jgi:hypothetical protein
VSQIKDSSVILNGVIVQENEVYAYDRESNTRTDVIDAYTYIVLSSDGALTVKLSAEEKAALSPKLGGRVVWRVVTSAWKQPSGASGQSTRFVSAVTAADLNALAADLGATPKAV